MPVTAGHRRGARQLESLLPAVAAAGIRTLTLFGFASANWRRDEAEVGHLMALAESTLVRVVPRCVHERISIEVIGRRDRLPGSLVSAIERAERATADGILELRIAIDYSARHAILNAAQRLGAEAVDERVFSACLGSAGDVDLLIRTGREQRLSDFMLWECAFAELYFADVYWPDFTADRLHQALHWYERRNRRFGA